MTRSRSSLSGWPRVAASAVLVLCSTVVTGEESDVPHKMRPGDVVSADVFNEIIAHIEGSIKQLTPGDLVGRWRATSIAPNRFGTDNDAAGWEAVTMAGGEFKRLSDITLTFTEKSDGTFGIASSVPNPIICQWDFAIDTEYTTIGNMLFFAFTVPAEDDPPAEAYTHYGTFRVHKAGPNRLVLLGDTMFGTTNYVIITCDRLDIPPTIPSDVSASTSANGVSVSWTDGSSDETGFKVLRRDTLDGSFEQVGTVGAGVTSFTDTDVSAGTFWYRVSASNANGDSLGSKPVRITVTD